MTWTDKRVESLKALWADGLSASQCAGQLGGVTRNGVIGKAHRLGLAGRQKPRRPKPIRAERTTPFRPRQPDGALPPVEISEPIILSTDYLCSLFQLSDRTCRWPCFEAGTPFDEQRYCGIPTADVYAGRSYCSGHSGLVHAAAAPRKQSYWTRNGGKAA